MIYQPQNPTGYRNLLTWSQAGKIYRMTKDFTRICLDFRKDRRLIDHMNDSARSVQRNIEEGFKRATTKEYIQFLGYSRASLEELKGDFEELKREWAEGLRWVNKGIDGIGREGAHAEIKELLDLIYGEDCMMGRQIKRLEDKMIRDKTAPKAEMVKRTIQICNSADGRFWQLARERFGVKKGW